MSTNNVVNYGWETDGAPQSCDYIAPFVIGLIDQYQPQRVLDIGSGNGRLCSLIAQSHRYICGMEYDAAGVELARKAYPSINFYHYIQYPCPKDMELQQPPRRGPSCPS